MKFEALFCIGDVRVSAQCIEIEVFEMNLEVICQFIVSAFVEDIT